MSNIIRSDGDYLVCPYCGNRMAVDCETFYSDSIECEEEMYCEKCDHDFIASREVTFHYSTFKSNDNEQSEKKNPA